MRHDGKIGEGSVDGYNNGVDIVGSIFLLRGGDQKKGVKSHIGPNWETLRKEKEI